MKIKHRLTYTRVIALSFLAVIAVGGLLLCLPLSSVQGKWTNPLNAYFTATSATCVTGLITYDTGSHWSGFGQGVILLLIQIGGLGFMTLMTMFTLFVKKRISLHERRLLMQSTGNLEMAGTVTRVKRILLGTLFFEAIGTSLLAIRFIPKMGALEGLWFSLFHSVSAFCNAGFDLMGKYRAFSSLTLWSDDVLVNVTVMALIVIGGIGFLVWNDLIEYKFHFRKYELHTRLVLCVTGVLILGGAGIFYFTEANAAFQGLAPGKRLLAAFFQSVTTRTAGFNTVDQAALSPGGSIISIVLMFIGGSPGSTAGGVKTVTLLVVLLNAIATVRNSDVILFKKRLEPRLAAQATAIVTIYFSAVTLGTTLISICENCPLREVLFEVVSAVGTVGLSMGLTPTLSAASRMILLLLMYFGRIGGFSLILALAERRENVPLERPTVKILIG